MTLFPNLKYIDVHFDMFFLSYFSLQCIPVGIKSTKRLGTTGTLCGEDPNIYFKVRCEFIVFQPVASSKVVAKVDKLSFSHIGLLIHEWFNASVSRDGGTEQVDNINVGDEVLLEVVHSDFNRRILCLECKLLKLL